MKTSRRGVTMLLQIVTLPCTHTPTSIKIPPYCLSSYLRIQFLTSFGRFFILLEA